MSEKEDVAAAFELRRSDQVPEGFLERVKELSSQVKDIIWPSTAQPSRDVNVVLSALTDTVCHVIYSYVVPDYRVQACRHMGESLVANMEIRLKQDAEDEQESTTDQS